MYFLGELMQWHIPMMEADNARLAAPNEVKLLASLGPDRPHVISDHRIHKPLYRIISRFCLLSTWDAVVLYDIVFV